MEILEEDLQFKECSIRTIAEISPLVSAADSRLSGADSRLTSPVDLTAF